MVRKSLRDVELHDFARRQAGWRKKLNPPYICPICCLEEVVQVSRKEISIKIGNKYHYGNIFRLWCEKGCFDVEVRFDSLCYKPVDAYCKVVDRIVVGKKEIDNKEKSD